MALCGDASMMILMIMEFIQISHITSRHYYLKILGLYW